MIFGHDKLVRTEWKNFPDIEILEINEKQFRQHPCYDEAKTGDIDAALELVSDYLDADKLYRINQKVQNTSPIIVAVDAVEGISVNVIPNVFATVLSVENNWRLDDSIKQLNRVGHTKSSGFHRMATPALFSGNIKKGEPYLIVDDFVGQGGTIANLRGYIESQGGFVVAAIVMAGKDYSAKLKLEQITLEKLREHHGNLESEWNAVFGYGFEFLTESEARYLINTKNAERIRTEVFGASQG